MAGMEETKIFIQNWYKIGCQFEFRDNSKNDIKIDQFSYHVVYIISLSNQIGLFSFMYIPMDVTGNTRFLPLHALPALLES